MDQELKAAIERLQNEVKEKQDFINMLKTLNLDEPVTEEIWHKICRTPLRSSKILGVILKQIFPEAEDIQVGCNYVLFSLFGFPCALPTSWAHGIEVRTNWYVEDRGMPDKKNMSNPALLEFEPHQNEVHYGINARMKQYFDAVDNHESWEMLLKYRFLESSRYQKWVRFLMWFFRYKWKDPHELL